MKNGPIILIDDDPEDKEIFEHILQELKVANKLIWLSNCSDAMHYLCTTTDNPFLIICDINLPKQSGLDFKKELDADPKLRMKSIPFVFCSTSVNQELVNRAYLEMTIQGFFQKSFSFEEFKNTVKQMLDYWSLCSHPNSG